MSKFHDKVEGRTKQFVGQIIGDDQVVRVKAKRKSAKPRTTAPAAAINPRPIKRWHTRTKVSSRIRRPASNRRTRNARNLSIKPTLITRFQEKRPLLTLQMMALGNRSQGRRFDFGSEQCKPIIVNEQCEVLSLMGHVAQGDDDKANLHLHAALDLAGDAVDPAGD